MAFWNNESLARLKGEQPANSDDNEKTFNNFDAHYYYADFVIWEKILLEAKALEKLTESHVKQVLNYLAASKLRVGLLVNFGGDVLEWKRVIL